MGVAMIIHIGESMHFTRMTVKKLASSAGMTLSKRSLKMFIYSSIPVYDRLLEIWYGLRWHRAYHICRGVLDCGVPRPELCSVALLNCFSARSTALSRGADL